VDTATHGIPVLPSRGRLPLGGETTGLLRAAAITYAVSGSDDRALDYLRRIYGAGEDLQAVLEHPDLARLSGRLQREEIVR
jgi:hypothetical protein